MAAPSPSLASVFSDPSDPFAFDALLRELGSAGPDFDTNRLLDEPLSPNSQLALRDALDASASDPFGDGDQSDVPDPANHPLRHAWASGLDWQAAVVHPGISPLPGVRHDASQVHLACYIGDAAGLKELLQNATRKTENKPGDIKKTLEARVSQLRLTPLHYACQGARDDSQPYLDAIAVAFPEYGDGDNRSTRKGEHARCIELLLQHGARVDAKDIAGYTPLAGLVGIGACEATLELVPLLVKHGANLNMTTRFRESIIMSAVMGCDAAAIRVLVRAGATIDVPDAHGITAKLLIKHMPSLWRAFKDGVRDRSCAGVCAFCGCTGASKQCGGCQQMYYCDRECQRGHWRNGHKKECVSNKNKQDSGDTSNSKSNRVGHSTITSGKDEDEENHTKNAISADDFASADTKTTAAVEDNKMVDIVISSMTANVKMKEHIHGFTNSLTGIFSNDRMRKKNVGKWFIVKIYQPTEYPLLSNDTTSTPIIKISERNSDFLLVERDGVDGCVSGPLMDMVKRWSRGSGKTYARAMWLDTQQQEGDTLRVDTSKAVTPPQPLW